MSKDALIPNRIFYVTVRVMPRNQKYTVPVLARTLDEAQRKATQESPYIPNNVGAFEYYRVDC